MVWLIVIGVVWCVVAVGLAVLIGRMVARREQQRPTANSVDLPAQRPRPAPAPSEPARPGLPGRLAARFTRRQ